MSSEASDFDVTTAAATPTGIGAAASLRTEALGESGSGKGLLPYISIARPDHWIKNAFMLMGAVLAYFYNVRAFTATAWLQLVWAIAATCLLASSNYVINEILDAPTDRSHPKKRHRPIPAGQVNLTVAYVEWIALGLVGMAMAYVLNLAFFATALALLVMGLVYNVRPVRLKELPYVDVLSESINNPLRLLLGWSVLVPSQLPPLSLMISYWMVGAFFMGTKRFSEYRSIGDPASAAAYRKSFRYYTEARLLVSMFFYATAAALFLGVFIIRYKLELILSIPLVAGFFSMYLNVALKPESAAQSPERLYREKGLVIYLAICIVAFVGLMFVDIPLVYELFNVEPSRLPALWKF